MDFGRIISRSVEIAFRQRAMWLFGFLLALTTAGGGGGGGGRGGGTPATPTPGGQGIPAIPGLPPGFNPDQIGQAFSRLSPQTLVALGLGLVALILVLSIVSIIIQYVSRAALIGMINQVEEGQPTSVRQGWGFGWSRFAWRTFAATFIVSFLGALLVIALVLAGAGIIAGTGLAFGGQGNSGNAALGGVAIAFGCLFLLLLIPLLIITTTVSNLAQRHVVIRDAGVFDSIAAGWHLFRANWGNLVLLIIILLGVGILWAVFLAIVGGVIGFGLAGGPGLLTFLLTNLTWAAILAALPGFIILLVVFALLGTWWAIFQEAVWTLAYRALPSPYAPPLTPTLPTPEPAQ